MFPDGAAASAACFAGLNDIGFATLRTFDYSDTCQGIVPRK